MTLQLPASFDPNKGLADVEKDVLRPLFQPSLTNTNVVSWIPKPDVYSAVLTAGGGYLRTYRMGGAWNEAQRRDEPIVQIAALRGSRDESWLLIKFVREVLRGLIREASIVNGFQIQVAGEVAGPHLVPELLQDDRLVPITVQFYTWPKGLPDYRAALGLDNL